MQQGKVRSLGTFSMWRPAAWSLSRNFFRQVLWMVVDLSCKALFSRLPFCPLSSLGTVSHTRTKSAAGRWSSWQEAQRPS